MADIRAEIPVDGPEVIKILANDYLFCKNWKLFCRALQFEQSIIYDLEKKESSNCSITDIVYNILAHWKSISTDYSLRILSEKLRENGRIAAAVKVENLGTSGNKTEPKKIWFNIRSPTTHYSGRNEEMLAIEQQWKKCEENKTTMFVAVTGLGGIGKSEIAKNYAKIFYENVKGHCIWIDSETDQTLLQSFQELARALKISVQDGSGNKKLNILTKEIYEKISNEKCLIIFDNMESYDNSILRQLIDLSSKKPPKILKPLILTTSRFRPAIKFFGDDKCIHLGLEVLSMESACQFFYKSFKLETPDSIPDNIFELIKKLCSRLQNYPLAMHQAAANIKETLFNNSTKDLKREIQNYLHEIEVRSKDILDHQLPEIEAVDVKTTFMTWSITMSKIEEVGESAVTIMEIISFMAPDNISTEFLWKIYGTMEGDAKNEMKTLFALRDHSMISLSEQKVSIHRLVQEVTRIQLIEKGKWTDCLHALLTAIQKMFQDEEIAGDQMIQAETVWSHASTNADLVTKHQQLPTWICWNFERLGKYREAYNFSCGAVSILERISGERSRWTLRLKCWKGNALENLGEYSEALVVLTEVHEKQKEFFGEEDDHCLQTCSLIGTVHWRLNNYEEALKWFKPALEIRERKFGNEHQKSLLLKNNIALVLDAQGKYKEAKELHQQTLEVRQRVLGVEHRQTLSTKFNLATVIYEQGEHEEALRMFQEVVEVQERMLEVDHPDTLLPKDWIAATYSCLGRKKEALQLWKEVAEKREKVLGPQHPHTLLAKNNVEELEKKLQSYNEK